MKLEKLVLINWGFVVSREYAMGETTLLSGPTGVGKSSFQDAIQLVMTGGKQHVNVFNSAQDEIGASPRSGAKIKRTLATYAVGMRDNLCARPAGSHTYVAAVFGPEPDEKASPFTALVAVEAQVTGTPEQGRSAQVSRRVFLVLPDVRAGESDFIASRRGCALEAVEVQQIYNHLRLRYPAVKVQRFDAIEDYLCRLYGLFRGTNTVGAIEAENAARAFVQSIARKTVGSVGELIREQVLAEPELSEQVRDIASLMQNVQRLHKLAQALQATRERLARLRTEGEGFIEAFEGALEAELGEALRRRWDAERTIEALEARRRSAESLAKLKREEAEKHREALNRANERLATLKGQLNGNPVAAERKRLQDAIGELGDTFATAGVGLLHAVAAAQDSLKRLAVLPDWASRCPPAIRPLLDRLIAQTAGLDTSAAIERCHGLAAAVRQGRLDLAALDTSNFATLDARLAELEADIHAPGGLFATLAGERAHLQAAGDALGREIGDLEERKAQLEAGRIDLPPIVAAAQRFIEERYPAARARVLCNLVRPREGSPWQNAIEGLLGGIRYALIVEPEYEARAIRAVRHELPALLKSASRERQSSAAGAASVIQGELARHKTEHLGLAAESILHELAFDDETAHAFLLASYGRYLKVTNEEALRTTAQGLTRDGMASGNYRMFRAWLDDGELAFGAEARRKRAARLGRDIEDKRRERQGLEQNESHLSGWLAELQAFRPQPVAAILAQLAEIQRRINGHKAVLNTLHSAEIDELERQLALAQEMFEKCERLRSRALEVAAGNEQEAKHTAEKIDTAQTELAARQNGLVDVAAKLDELARLNPMLPRQEIAARSTALACCETGQTVEQFEGRRRVLTGRYRELREAFERGLEEHNRLAASPDEAVKYAPEHSVYAEREWWAYGGVLAARKQIVAMLDRLDQVRIVQSTRELATAEKSFTDTFTSSFAFAVRAAVEQGIQPLKRLNEKLARLSFGEDRFEIEYGRMVKEYKRYLELFQELNRLAETQVPIHLFGDATASGLSAGGAATLEEIKQLLLDPNQDFALRRLRDIADYRNYREYDIRKYSEDGREASLSRMATFSGGELMTPGYLVRAAVLAQAFRQFDKTPSLKLMMIDEAFDKMDETRTAAVMRYLNETLGLQLIVAMPTRSSGPLLDLFTHEHRFSLMKVEGHAGELDRVTEIDSVGLKTERVRALWEQRRVQVRADAEAEFVIQEVRQAASLTPGPSPGGRGELGAAGGGESGGELGAAEGPQRLGEERA